MRQRSLAAGLLMVLALVTGACGSDDPAVDSGDDSNNTTTTESLAPPKFEAGTTMATLQAEGKLVVGTKFDQPGFGLRNPTTGEVEGFDVEVAKIIAQNIFGGTKEEAAQKIEFKESVSKNREPFIQNGDVDVVVATYTINDARKQVVDFAGPYFVAEQDIMVKADNTEIKSVDDLNDQKVCTVKGSTSEKNLKAKAPEAEVTLFEGYSQCAEALTDGRVTAVTTDNTILAGLVQTSGGQFKLLKAPFSEEPYGIGLKKDDTAFRNFINDVLEESFENGEWEEAFTSTLGAIGLETPEAPAVDRYGPGAVSGSGEAGESTTSTKA
ncbi:MAG TPA: glutamate ABC transporter substrate-binding protein [Acidimicrobiales bacterium]|nr:glutamate ABC transporter substrate-binding protein [Acidimicrobiales bacterium]